MPRPPPAAEPGPHLRKAAGTSPGLDTPQRGFVPQPRWLLDLAEPTRPARPSRPAARLRCGRPETEVRVTKVIDLNQPVSVDRYEVGARMALRVALREPTCVFPWCSRPARQCDKDHCTPYAEGGGTCDHNLAPLCRRHHRLKTHTAWTYERLPLDIGWRWTDPHGMRYLRDHHGTRPLRRRRHLQTA